MKQSATTAKKTGSTVVIVSHSMDDVARIADRLIVFNHGSIRFDGTPEEVFSNPKELSDIGLSVPAPTQIASALRESRALRSKARSTPPSNCLPHS